MPRSPADSKLAASRRLALSKLWRLSRPRFWIYVFGPYIVGLLAGARRLADLQSPTVLLFGLYFLFPANILIYGVNDIFDYETDKDNAKKTEYETLVMPHERAALWWVIALMNAPFLLLLSQVNRAARFTMLVFWFFSACYSAPPIRAKARPILDSAFNVLYILPGVFAFYVAGGAALSPGLVGAAWCWAMAMHAYSAVPDISADRSNRLSTVATLLGLRGTLWFCAALYAASALLSFRTLGWLSLGLGGVYLALTGRSLHAGGDAGEAGVLRIYKVFPLANTLCGAALFRAIALRKFF